MSTPLNLKIDPDKVMEIPMVDLAFMILKVANTTYYYRDLMKEVAKIRGMSEQEANEAIAQLYTEINIDGRFACVGTNQWGLKRWYPIEKSEDPVGNAKRPRIINDDDGDEDFGEDEETFTPDGDGFDKVDEDQDELFTDEEEEDVEEVEDEPLLEDEELDEDEDDLAEEDDSESEDDVDDEEDEN